jgi:adenylate cyclase
MLVLPDNRKMEFRIGVNLGDVIEDEDRVYGDGVNIAARIEGLADPGGICISGSGFEQVRNKLSLGYEYLGEHTVKNIVQPIKVYRILMQPEHSGKVIGERGPGQTQWRWVAVAATLLVLVAGGLVWNFYGRAPKIEPASKEKMAFPLPDKPSIAVLPFVNVSGDPKEDYFSDGLTEQIITSLSKLPRLFVIARNSTFVYKGKPVKIQKVAEDLGVRYVLEGSFQKSGDRVRITAQLIDAIKGRHIWSEHYDRELKDIFALQDEITIKIMNGMSIELTEGEQARRWTKAGTTNLKALEKNYQAFAYFMRNTKEDNDTARQLYEEAITLDPQFVWPYVYLGYNYFASARYGWSESPAKSYQTAFELAQKALAIDESDDRVHTLLSILYLAMREYDKSLFEAERAVALNPNGADAYFSLAAIVGCSGRWEESVPYAEKMVRLGPFPGVSHYFVLGRAYFMTGQYDESIVTWKKVLKISPEFLIAHLFLAACYSSMGRYTEATAAAQEILRINPKFTTESHAKTLPYKNKADVEREIGALRKAGLPEKPPLPLPDKPSIAVLPFVNMSEDKGQEYFSDGLTEEIITALSKTPKLFVIARNSSFVYKGKPVNVQQVSRDLGVKYVLEGSVRRSGDQLRITAQLIDGTTGNHLWAERYDKEMKDIFSIQDEVTMKILTSLQVKLTDGEIIRMAAKGTKNLDAYLKYLQAADLINQFNKESNIKAREPAEEAIRLDPLFPAAYSMLGGINMMDVWLQISKSPKDSLMKAIEFHQKALSLDDSFATSRAFLGFLYVQIREHEKGIAEAERAVEISPNFASGYSLLAQVLNYSGRPEEAITNNERAFRLNPMDRPSFYYAHVAHTCTLIARYEDGIKVCKEGLSRFPDNALLHARLAMLYAALGRTEEARSSVQEVLRIDSKFSAQRYAKSMPYKDPAVTDQSLELMRKAGLPD